MLITIADQYCWLGKASACQIEILDVLLRELEVKWLTHGHDTRAMLEQPYSQLVGKVLAIIPSESGLEISIDLLRKDLIAFEELFFRSRSGQSLIAEHHKFEPKLKRLEAKPGEPVTAQHLPFPTSGNAADDQLASLLTSFGPDTSLWAWHNLSLDRIDRVLYSLKELNIPENDRIAAYVAQLAIEKDPSILSVEDAERAFADMESFISTGELKNGWKSSRG